MVIMEAGRLTLLSMILGHLQLLILLIGLVDLKTVWSMAESTTDASTYGPPFPIPTAGSQIDCTREKERLDHFVERGKTVNMPCNITCKESNKIKTFTWSFKPQCGDLNGTKILYVDGQPSSSARTDLSTILFDYDKTTNGLIINKMVPELMGNYTCKVELQDTYATAKPVMTLHTVTMVMMTNDAGRNYAGASAILFATIFTQNFG